MALTINTNIASLTAQRNLATTQSSLQTAMQRLSSGLRINTAADDAAGLAIASRFTAQINGVNQAVLNANDGGSLAQTADSALGSVTDNLQRMRTLAVEAANATNSASDRAALQNEVAQRVSEIDRVATQTQFNGVSLIDGSFQAQQFQVGANSGQTITVANISSARTSALGVTYSATKASSQALVALGAGQMTINGTAINASVTDGVSFASATGSAQAIINAINGSGVTGVSASLTTHATQTAAGNVVAADAVLAAGNLVINGVNITGVVNAGSAAADVQGLINAQQFATGVNATLSGSKIVLTAVDGRNITETSNAGGTAITGFATSTITSAGTITLTSNSASSAAAAALTITNTGTNGGFVAGDSTAASATGATISALDITTVNGANAAINSIDSALAAINTTRSQMGAVQNRFQSVVANLQTTSTNLAAARSQIQDADFAAETANFTRSQILQQAGTAMLAQANSLPNSVLSLLK